MHLACLAFCLIGRARQNPWARARISLGGATRVCYVIRMETNDTTPATQPKIRLTQGVRAAG